MVARAGLWRGHPGMGTELVTAAHLQSALDYFKGHYAAHGADLVIDYHHASIVAPLDGTRAPAAGWIRTMELRRDGAELWGQVMWTTEAANAIARREYRYLSPVLRFGAPDRVTGEPVPLQVHSVALTNTPFLTELQALNQVGASGASIPTASENGGEQMTLMDLLCKALGLKPEEIASKLGLKDTEDAAVANAVMALPARVAELEARVASASDGPPAVIPDYICNTIGVAAGSDETTVKAALLKLRAPSAGLAAVRAKLGLPDAADDGALLSTIGALQAARRKNDAEELVDEAVQAGKIPPAHRDFYLQAALDDIAAARLVVNSLPVLVAQSFSRSGRHTQRLGDRFRRAERRALSDGEAAVCRQLGLSAEAFINSAGPPEADSLTEGGA
jgi:phage I-like protein